MELLQIKYIFFVYSFISYHYKDVLSCTLYNDSDTKNDRNVDKNKSTIIKMNASCTKCAILKRWWIKLPKISMNTRRAILLTPDSYGGYPNASRLFSNIQPGEDPGRTKICQWGACLEKTSSDWKATATNRVHSSDLKSWGEKCCYFWFHSEVKFMTRLKVYCRKGWLCVPIHIHALVHPFLHLNKNTSLKFIKIFKI